MWVFRIGKHILLSLFVGFGYYLGTKLSFAFQIPASSIPLIWLPNSIDFSARDFLGLQMGSVVFSVVPLILSEIFEEGRYLTALVGDTESSGELKLDRHLTEGEPMNSSILKVLPDLAFLIHENGTYLDYHARSDSELYVPPKDFLGKNVRDIMPPHLADQVFGYFKAAKQTGATQCFEYSLEMNGFENTYECRIVQSGSDKFLSIVRDITEQKKTRKALEETRQMFEAQYRNLPVPAYIWRKSGDDFVLIDFNHAANAIIKGKAANLVGIKAGDEYRDFPVIFEGFNRCFNEKLTVELEMPHQPSPYAAEKYVFLTYVFIPPDMVMFHIQDLTERKRTLDELEARLVELKKAKEEIALQNKELRLSHAKIEEEKERYRELFNSAPDGYLVTDCSGGILEANEAAAELLDAKQERLKGFPIAAFVSFEEREVFRKLLAKMQVGKNVHEIEINLNAQSRKFHAAVKVAPVFNHGEVNLRWIIRDITERTRARRELQQSEEFNRRIIESSIDCIKILDLKGKLLYLNPKGQELLEMEETSCLGTSWLEFWNESEQALLKPEIEKAKKGGIGRFQGQNPTARGTNKWWDVLITPITDVEGKIERLLVVSRDITSQKQATERLRESEERFNSFMNNSPVAAWIEDEDGRVLYLNSAFVESINLPKGEVIGKTLYDVFSNELAGKYHSLIKEVLEAEEPQKSLVQIIRTDGSTGTFSAYRFPLASSNEGKRLVGGFAIDITDQRQIEKALSESEEKYRRIVETMLEGIWITNTEMQIAFASHQLAEKLGYKLEEMLGQPVFDFYDEETRLLAPQIMERRRSGLSERYDAKLRRKDGSYIWVNISASPYYDLNGKYAGSLAMVLDITERKQAEDNLRESEALLRGLIQNIPDVAIGILDKDFRYIMAEGQELEKVKLSNELIKGKLMSDLFPKEAVEFVLPYFEQALGGEEVWFELPVNGFFYQAYAMPLRDQNEFIYAIFVVIRNITEQKQKEEKLQQLSARILTVQDEERRRLARELHDETAQNIALLGINLGAVKKILSPDDKKALHLLRDSELLVLRSLREVRTISYLLHPPMLDDGGLVSALKWFIDGFAARSEIDVTFSLTEEIGRLSSDIETALYRIVQECLTNIHRHSGSQTASIKLTKEPDKIILLVKDKGRGMPKSVPEAEGKEFSLPGVGIPGMRERLRLLGGHLEIASNKKGTTLTATIPLEANAHD